MAYNRGAASAKGSDAAAAAAAEESRRSQALQRARCIVDTFDGIKVHFLLAGVEELEKKASFRGFFDVVHLSTSSSHHLGEEGFNGLLAGNARVVVETTEYLVPLTADQDAEYCEKIRMLAAERDLDPSPSEELPSGHMGFWSTTCGRHKETPREEGKETKI